MTLLDRLRAAWQKGQERPDTRSNLLIIEQFVRNFPLLLGKRLEIPIDPNDAGVERLVLRSQEGLIQVVSMHESREFSSFAYFDFESGTFYPHNNDSQVFRDIFAVPQRVLKDALIRVNSRISLG